MTVHLVISLPKIPYIHHIYISGFGQNRIYTQYMTVYLVISLPKIPYIHRIYIWFWPTLVPTHSTKAAFVEVPVWGHYTAEALKGENCRTTPAHPHTYCAI